MPPRRRSSRSIQATNPVPQLVAYRANQRSRGAVTNLSSQPDHGEPLFLPDPDEDTERCVGDNNDDTLGENEEHQMDYQSRSSSPISISSSSTHADDIEQVLENLEDGFYDSNDIVTSVEDDNLVDPHYRTLLKDTQDTENYTEALSMLCEAILSMKALVHLTLEYRLSNPPPTPSDSRQHHLTIIQTIDIKRRRVDTSDVNLKAMFDALSGQPGPIAQTLATLSTYYPNNNPFVGMTRRLVQDHDVSDCSFHQYGRLQEVLTAGTRAAETIARPILDYEPLMQELCRDANHPTSDPEMHPIFLVHLSCDDKEPAASGDNGDNCISTASNPTEMQQPPSLAASPQSPTATSLEPPIPPEEIYFSQSTPGFASSSQLNAAPAPQIPSPTTIAPSQVQCTNPLHSYPSITAIASVQATSITHSNTPPASAVQLYLESYPQSLPLINEIRTWLHSRPQYGKAYCRIRAGRLIEQLHEVLQIYPAQKRYPTLSDGLLLKPEALAQYFSLGSSTYASFRTMYNNALHIYWTLDHTTPRDKEQEELYEVLRIMLRDTDVVLSECPQFSREFQVAGKMNVASYEYMIKPYPKRK
ncbi:hypothetical protein VNI00_004216 [Paramarasmius palmivorus]|uniref:Uncharacterized protein n=1 Tax=Paramarasmius palmivorus TaxID=297713 RepID=A0AAW0DK67_9AGAR